MRETTPRGRPAPRSGAAAGLLLAAATLLVGPTPALAATPIDGGSFTIFPVAIDTSPGDQFDPHLSGDLVSYTSADRVRTYDFFSGNTAAVPFPPGSDDLLSDVSNGRIAFSRIEASGRIPVLVYDTVTSATTEIRPEALPQQFSAGIGSSTVALIDQNVAGGELVIAAIGGTSIQVTSDARTDQSPQVAPAGDLVVYESCGTSCDIRQARWVGASWVVSNITANADEEHNPDTDGTLIAYDAIRSGDQDIAWQPVGGGPEQHLELPGLQRNPSIRHGIVAFESIAPGDTDADLFLYEIATNRLFRVTSTPTDDSLSDLDVLPTGQVRVVWTAGPFPERDVYGATIELPPVGPTYHFGGFQQPVDARPTLNQMKAGGAVPVKFTLGGNQGLSIFAAGSPKSQVIACDATADVDGIEQTVTAGGSSLTYDPTSDTYTYIWKTDKAWAGTCRQLVLAFADGGTQRANFKFK